MKRFVITTVIIHFILSLFAGVVLAGNTYDPGIQERIENQKKRIVQGVKSRQLTRGEAKTLKSNLKWIAAERFRLKKDARLNNWERARLHNLLDLNSAMIYKKKHNPVRRLFK